MVPMSTELIRNRNKLALGLLVLAKVLGVAGLVVAASDRFAGGFLLALDGVFIVGAVVLALGTMQRRNKEEEAHKQVLEQMLREGTLEQYLKDLRAEGRAPPSRERPPSS